MASDYTIELVGKIVRMLEVLKNWRVGISLQQVALRTAYVKNSVHRILLSLKKLGHIEKTDPSKIALDLDRVRRKGYSLNDEERSSGQCSWPPRYSIPVSGYSAVYR